MAPRADSDHVGDTRTMREIMLDHLSRHFGKSSMELSDDVQNDYGSFGSRRFHRSLAHLIRVGCVRRDREWDLELGHWRPVYFLIHRDIPDGGGQQWCRSCGLIGTRTGSHPLHIRRHREGGELRYMHPFLATSDLRRGDVAPAAESGATSRREADGAREPVDREELAVLIQPRLARLG